MSMRPTWYKYSPVTMLYTLTCLANELAYILIINLLSQAHAVRSHRVIVIVELSLLGIIGGVTDISIIVDWSLLLLAGR